VYSEEFTATAYEWNSTW